MEEPAAEPRRRHHYGGFQQAVVAHSVSAAERSDHPAVDGQDVVDREEIRPIRHSASRRSTSRRSVTTRPKAASNRSLLTGSG